MYERASSSIRLHDATTNIFSIKTGLHQGSTLSPYLFTLGLDVLTKHILELAPRCMFFEDDTVLLGESRDELNASL